MSYLSIDGCRLEVRTIPGDPAKPWLVLLHEGLGSVSLWRDFPDKLARRTGAPVLLYSRRGYGKSDSLDGPRDIDFMHREAHEVLPELLDQAGIERAVLVGHSDGASIALIHAASNPGRIAGAILMAPHVLVEPISTESIRAIKTVYETTDLRARLSRHHAHVDDAFLGWANIWLDPRFADWSLAEECAHLEVPIVLIQGENDEYGTLAQIDTIAAASRGPVTRVVLPDCGHAPHRDAEDEVAGHVARMVEAVISRIPGSS
ncbi:MAG: alpha/beta hydrolase [Hyphomicrobiaceae bacterium]